LLVALRAIDSKLVIECRAAHTRTQAEHAMCGVRGVIDRDEFMDKWVSSKSGAAPLVGKA
jgi:hypothetical protein